MKGCIAGCLLLAFQFSFCSVFANNVHVDGTVKVVEVNSGVATLEFDLSWENSWRDSYNWDAVWVFLKYKSGVSGEWTHVNLSESGHTFFQSGIDAMAGKNGDNTVKGLFIHRTSESAGNVSVTCQLKWVLPSGLTKSSFDNHDAFLMVHGVEMVFVPYGANVVGDGRSNHCFTVGDSSNVVIASEEALSLGVRNSSSVNVPATYPKGYQGFYVMKYEVSQDQYVRFLNQLTRVQQEELLGVARLSGLVAGDYIFGSRSGVSNRNGIILSRNLGAGKPFIFGHRFTANDNYADDGQCVACNYMSIRDLLAYSAWSGLRPMSELEYERACRRPYPEVPEMGEYAWNENVGLSASGRLMSDGLETESVSGGNANCGGSQSGPLRCGVFATQGSNQTASGGTFWGVMEMGGNVKELCGNVSNTGLSRTVNGGGAYATNLWSMVPSQFGLRGGGFTSPDSLLRVSDRTEISSLSDLDRRDSTVGFRLVRTLDAGSVTVNAGELSPLTKLCPPTDTITEKTPASVTPPSGLSLTYIWYVKEGGDAFTVVPGESGKTLTYNKTKENTAYQFKRKVVCSLGEAETFSTAATSLIPVKITTQPVGLSTCIGGDFTLTVVASGSDLTYQWMKDESPVSGATTATYSNTGILSADSGVYRCVVNGSCNSEQSSSANVSMLRATSLTDPRDGKVYQTRIMADGREWMIEDLKFGDCSSSSFSSFSTGTTQNIIWPGYYGVCIPSTQPDAGYLYNWQAAMNSVDAYDGGSNPSGNVDGSSPTQWQGICPDGWHLPSNGRNGEYYLLYNALKDGTKFHPGTTCDGWRGVLGGGASGSSVGSVNSQGFWWTSTTNGGSAYVFNLYGSSVYQQWPYGKALGYAVRCVKNYD